MRAVLRSELLCVWGGGCSLGCLEGQAFLAELSVGLLQGGGVGAQELGKLPRPRVTVPTHGGDTSLEALDHQGCGFGSKVLLGQQSGVAGVVGSTSGSLGAKVGVEPTHPEDFGVQQGLCGLPAVVEVGPQCFGQVVGLGALWSPDRAGVL